MHASIFRVWDWEDRHYTVRGVRAGRLGIGVMSVMSRNASDRPTGRLMSGDVWKTVPSELCSP